MVLCSNSFPLVNMGDCTWCWYGGKYLFCVWIPQLGNLSNSCLPCLYYSMTDLSLLGFVTYILSLLMVTILLHGVFTPELAHPGACHSSSKGKCPALLAVKQCWVQSLFWSRLVFSLFLSNELVNLNEEETDKLLLSRAWMLLAGTWPGGICRVFNWHLPAAVAAA